MKNLWFILLLFPVCAFGQNKKLNKGIAFFEKEQYAEALKQLSKAGNPKDDLNLTYYLARTNHLLQNLDTAHYYYSILDQKNTKNSEYLIHYADLSIKLNEYDLAKRALRKLLAYEPNNGRAKLLLEGCVQVSELNKNPNFYITSFLNLNSNDDDFSPILMSKNELLFCSNRAEENNNKGFSRDQTRFINIYRSQKGIATGFDKATGASGLNANLHEGPMAFDPISKKLYFTRSIKVAHKNFGYSYTLAIFTSEFDGEYWSKPKAFDYNVAGYSVGHPAISPDGQYLYFISDQPGGSGLTDIYQCKRIGNTWDSPQNLKSINTPYNEMFPTVLASGLLSFASNGYVGLGGLDIFIIKNDSVKNAGAPINSSKDDFGLITNNNDNNYGFFSSNRKAQLGGDNIYSFKPIAILVSGYIIDSVSKKPVKEGSWRIVDSKGNITDIEADKKGFFTLPLKPNDVFTFQFTAPNYNMKKAPFNTQNLNRDIDTLLNIELSRGVTPILEGVVVDKADTTPVAGAKVKLTDVQKGKSESLETDTTGYYIFFVDSTKQYELNIDHPKFLVSSMPISKIESKYQTKTNSAFNIKMVSIEPIVLNKPLEIENIYYDYDKYDITPTSASILDTLYNLMVSNEDIVVELSSHTDIRGTDEYNVTLSKQRAKAAIDYLIAKGIEDYRLVFKFYGKTELAVPCPSSGECPESVHKLNRRTEFRIVGY
ncbi:MAG: OmpA family protein [Bacteroidia bacterium]